MEKSVVLLSSGLDSTVNLYEAHKATEVVMALTFNYGQRAFSQESRHAQKSCEKLGIPHKVLDLTWFKDFTQTSLVNHDQLVPTQEVSIDDLEASQKTAEKVWVPNRNGVFLNIGAAYAEGLGAQYIVPGFNAEEAVTFADNSQEFIDKLNQSFELSTGTKIQAKCYTTHLNKTDIVRRGRELKVDFESIWPCYFSGEILCGQCESCKRYKRALKEA